MVQSTIEVTSEELIAKLDRRAQAQRKLAGELRKLAAFDEEIRDALARFRNAGGVDEIAHSLGGQSDDDRHGDTPGD